MSLLSPATPAAPAAGGPSIPASASRARARRRALIVTGGIALLSAGLLVDLLLVGHTSGEELWGPVTAAFGAVVGTLAFTYLALRGRSRAARILLYALFLTVAFFGYGGYNDHRLPTPAGVVDERTRPPLAPLTFTVLGIAGALALRSGSKEH
jgi:peptidoglycan/LPS O-acetylase OafA/YrhL